MRKVLSQSTGPRLVFTSTGRLKQFRTGTDNVVEQQRTPLDLASSVCAGLDGGKARSDIYRIDRGHCLQFIPLSVGEDSAVEAVLGFSISVYTDARELDDPSVLEILQDFKNDVAAALGWGSFAIRVRGTAKVEALAQFYEAILAGDVALVPPPRFAKNPWKCPGVALVNVKELSEEERTLFNTDIGAFLNLSFGD